MTERAFLGAADGQLITTQGTYYASLGQSASAGIGLATDPALVQNTHRGPDATLAGLFVRVSNSTRTAGSTVTVVKNGSPTSLSVTIPVGATFSGSDLVNTVSLTAGDTYCYLVSTVGGTGNLLMSSVSVSAAASSPSVPLTGTGSQGSSVASASRYQLVAGVLGTVQTAEAISQIPAKTAASLSGLAAHVTANTRTTSTTVRLRVNGSDGAQSVVIGAGATGRFEDATNSDTLVAGDLFAPAIVTGSGSGTITFSLMEVRYTSTTSQKSPLYARTASGSLAAAATRYASPIGRFAPNATEGTVQVPAPYAMRLSELGLKVSANASTTDVTARLRINGANGTQTVTIPAGSTGSFTDGSNTDTVAQGDLLAISLAGGTTGTLTFNGSSLVAEELIALTATGLTVSSPELGLPTVGQVHGLTATGLSPASPALGSPAVTQAHGLSASNLTPAAPDLGEPTLAIVLEHDLVASNLVTASPAIGSAVLGQYHALSGQGIDVSALDIGSPVMVVTGPPLGGLDLITGSPDLGAPQLGQQYRRRSVFVLG